MLRLWRDIHAEKSTVSMSAGFSVIIHVALIAGAVAATQRPAQLDDRSEELANRPYYIPPPNRLPGQRATAEHIQFIAMAPQGPGSGFGPAEIDATKRFGPGHTSDVAGNIGRDSLRNTLPRVGLTGSDSVLTAVEVDFTVARDPASAAPSYPAELLARNVQGSVQAQYVVDTTGRAEPASLRIVRATHPLFVEAVRKALPDMRFSPATLAGKKVRQLVEQEFTFRIEPPKVAEQGKKP